MQAHRLLHAHAVPDGAKQLLAWHSVAVCLICNTAALPECCPEHIHSVAVCSLCNNSEPGCWRNLPSAMTHLQLLCCCCATSARLTLIVGASFARVAALQLALLMQCAHHTQRRAVASSGQAACVAVRQHSHLAARPRMGLAAGSNSRQQRCSTCCTNRLHRGTQWHI